MGAYSYNIGILMRVLCMLNIVPAVILVLFSFSLTTCQTEAPHPNESTDIIDTTETDTNESSNTANVANIDNVDTYRFWTIAGRH